MKWWRQVVVFVLLLLIPAVAQAGAWPQSSGQTQVIVSFEGGSASKAFDSRGKLSTPLTTWKQSDFSVYADHGLTSRLTLTGKVNVKDYRTNSTRFSGLGSVEVGARWTVHKGDDYVFALGASVEGLGKGRRSDFDVSTRQGTDYDLRGYFGKSFKFGQTDGYINIEVARHLRQYDAHQWRVDTTVGLKPSARWTIMAQSFAGQTDKQSWGQAKWNNVQLSVVRSYGPRQDTNLQLGVRQTVTGRNVPAVHAVIASVWKTF